MAINKTASELIIKTNQELALTTELYCKGVCSYDRLLCSYHLAEICEKLIKIQVHCKFNKTRRIKEDDLCTLVYLYVHNSNSKLNVWVPDSIGKYYTRISDWKKSFLKVPSRGVTFNDIPDSDLQDVLNACMGWYKKVLNMYLD